MVISDELRVQANACIDKMYNTGLLLTCHCEHPVCDSVQGLSSSSFYVCVCVYFIYLSVPGLGCSRQNLLDMACGIQFPEQGWNLQPAVLKDWSFGQRTTREVPQVHYI